MQAELFISFFSVFNVLLLNIRLTVILTVEKQTSEYHLLNETNIMHITQMAQEQHAIYFGYTFFRRFRQILQES